MRITWEQLGEEIKMMGEEDRKKEVLIGVSDGFLSGKEVKFINEDDDIDVIELYNGRPYIETEPAQRNDSDIAKDLNDLLGGD